MRCLSLRVRKVIVPPHEIKGKKVELECQYDLEGDQLYSVKWYKGIKEFFRYVPADNPPIQVFHLPGVSVDVSVPYVICYD
ncbi:hypothetical protein O3P69_018102 [Scylla paramamosain]|uniref:Beat protein n=1 Tax=Scylla paramamosain TaxID=85552 RepID=A0AAW0TLK4_SCYPA